MDQIAQVKQHTDIVTLIGSYVALKKAGKSYKGLCPFHSEKTSSFIVSPELQIYKCFGCGAAGDALEFLQKIEGIEFGQALETLAERAGIKLDKIRIDPQSKLKEDIYRLNEQVARFYNQVMTSHDMGKAGLDYITKKRGLTKKTTTDFMIGYAPDAFDTLYGFFTKKGISTDLLLKADLVTNRNNRYVDKFRGRIVFPFVNTDGKVLGFTGRAVGEQQPKYLNSSETVVFHKSFFVYGLNKAKVAIKKEGAVLVEGQMDVIAAHQHGFENVVAATGTSLTEGQLKTLQRYTNNLTFCFDADTAGVNASFRAISMAEKLGFDLRVIVLPAGIKDLDELVTKDKEHAKKVFTSAIPAYDFVLFSVIKKYDKDSPDGKKKIVDELIPWFAQISNKVLFDHYCKEIAKELNLNEETVVAAIKNDTKPSEEAFGDFTPAEKSHSSLPLEAYIISLLFKGSIDFMRSMGYKVEPEDFLDPVNRDLFVKLREYINGKIDLFDPNKFKKTLTADQIAVFENLYLHTVDEIDIEDSAAFEREVQTVLSRLKLDSTKRRMNKISEEIRLAEKSGSSSAVKKLTAEFEELKSQLL